MINDMVLDKNGNPALCNSPEFCKNWLRFQAEQDPKYWGYRVRLGKNMKTVSVQQYLQESEEK